MTPPERFLTPPAHYGFTLLRHSGLVTAKPAYLVSIILTSIGQTGSFSIYNGQDDSPFGLFHTFVVPTSVTIDRPFGSFVYFNRGIYAVLDSYLKYATVIWCPVPRQLGEPQSPFLH